MIDSCTCSGTEKNGSGGGGGDYSELETDFTKRS
jgi:hypothetical protein